MSSMSPLHVVNLSSAFLGFFLVFMCLTFFGIAVQCCIFPDDPNFRLRGIEFSYNFFSLVMGIIWVLVSLGFFIGIKYGGNIGKIEIYPDHVRLYEAGALVLALKTIPPKRLAISEFESIRLSYSSNYNTVEKRHGNFIFLHFKHPNKKKYSFKVAFTDEQKAKDVLLAIKKDNRF